MNAKASFHASMCLVWGTFLAVLVLSQVGCTRIYSIEEPRACNAPSVYLFEHDTGWNAATAISPTVLVTAAHVLKHDDDSSVTVHELVCNADGRLEYGASLNGRVELQDKTRDLAWLTVTGGRLQRVAEVRKTPVTPGERVYIHSKRSHGTEMVADSPGSAHAKVTGLMQLGDSGGGVFDDRGRFVGVVQEAICAADGCTQMSTRETDNGWDVVYEDTLVGVKWRVP